ncbi:unnamed protein product [Jaminaea pallidilutea]
MKIYALMIYAVPPGANAVALSTAWKLDEFNWLQRGTVQDVMNFMSKTVAERTPPTQRQSVQENAYTAHVHARPAHEGITGVLVSDAEYPVRVAFSLLNKLLDDFSLKVHKTSYQSRVNSITTGTADGPAKGEGIVPASSFPQMAEYITRYQDPRQADAIMKVQQELDETKIVLHKTIESVLARGEHLDSLVERSNTLQQSSKQFYKTAKRTNSCCSIM